MVIRWCGDLVSWASAHRITKSPNNQNFEEILNMKKQILLIVMTLCAVSAMAVSLPSVSYNSYVTEANADNAFQLTVGTTFVNQSTVGAYSGSCNPDSWQSDINTCKTCCTGELMQCDWTCNGDKACEQGCMEQNKACHEACESAELGQPLDAPTAFLLAMIAAYGALMLYRRKQCI